MMIWFVDFMKIYIFTQPNNSLELYFLKIDFDLIIKKVYLDHWKI